MEFRIKEVAKSKEYDAAYRSIRTELDTWISMFLRCEQQGEKVVIILPTYEGTELRIPLPHESNVDPKTGRHYSDGEAMLEDIKASLYSTVRILMERVEGNTAEIWSGESNSRSGYSREGFFITGYNPIQWTNE